MKSPLAAWRQGAARPQAAKTEGALLAFLELLQLDDDFLLADLDDLLDHADLLGEVGGAIDLRAVGVDVALDGDGVVLAGRDLDLLLLAALVLGLERFLADLRLDLPAVVGVRRQRQELDG